MDFYLGLDIGGTKIAGAVFHPDGTMLCQHHLPTPSDYEGFVGNCVEVVRYLEKKVNKTCHIGIGIPGIIDVWFGTVDAANLPMIKNQPLRDDLSKILEREIRFGNDANCMALAEAVDGAGVGYDTMIGLIVGTGIGAGFICNRYIIGGVNGLAGELGHIPMPYCEESDGPRIACYCGQTGCIESMISGPAFARLYTFITGKKAEPPEIAAAARAGDADALKTIDRYYDVFAKAMLIVLHGFDPAAIVVSGGMNDLPGFYEEVPKRWGKYCYVKKPKTKLLKAVHGPMAGLRGAAWLWRTQETAKPSRQTACILKP